MDGYLGKKTVGKYISMYKQRYFRTNGAMLEYFNTHTDRTPRGSISLYEMDEVSAKSGGDLKLQVSSTIGNWAYSLLAGSKYERDAWISFLERYTTVTSINDHVPIGPLLTAGILSAIEFCTFYASDVEGLFRVPGNGAVVEEIYQGIVRYGEKWLTNPHDDLQDLKEQRMSISKGYHRVNAKSPRVYIEDETRIGVYDVFDTGSAVKLALRSLPETLFTNLLFDEFMSAHSAEEYERLVQQLPEENAMILSALIDITLLLWQGEEVTLMDPGKVSVCLGPNLLKRGTDSGFCDLSSMFFEMASNHESIFKSIMVTRYFPGNFWDYLGLLEAGQNVDEYKFDEPEAGFAFDRSTLYEMENDVQAIQSSIQNEKECYIDCIEKMSGDGDDSVMEFISLELPPIELPLPGGDEKTSQIESLVDCLEDSTTRNHDSKAVPSKQGAIAPERKEEKELDSELKDIVDEYSTAPAHDCVDLALQIEPESDRSFDSDDIPMTTKMFYRDVVLLALKREAQYQPSICEVKPSGTSSLENISKVDQ